MEWEEYLRASAVPVTALEALLAGEGWASFDSELGYVNRMAAIDWGIDGSRTIQTYSSNGARTSFMYAGRRPRIACYGESLVQGPQVNDGETWEEYLAGHLGEPVANYGVGGSGLYQAYRRLVREESRGAASSVVVIGIAEYSGVRSVLPALWPAEYRQWSGFSTELPVFHGNFWPHLDLDLETGRFRERANLLRTADDLRLMSDPEWVWRTLRDSVPLRVHTVAEGRVSDLDPGPTARLADLLHTTYDRSGNPLVEARRIIELLSITASLNVMGRVIDEATARSIRLLVLFAPLYGNTVLGYTAVRDFLETRGVDYVDMNDVHRIEHERSTEPYRDYLGQYLIHDRDVVGHYNSRGNHLVAYAMKNEVVALLGAKPLPYLRPESGEVDLEAYGRFRLLNDRPGLASDATDTVLAAGSRLEMIVRELRRRLAEPWDVEKMAGLARFSRSGLHRRFVETFGVGPMGYLKSLRLEEAARMLAQGDATLERIAADVGFANRSHLSREFAHRFGVPPARYRRELHRHPSATPGHIRTGTPPPTV